MLPLKSSWMTPAAATASFEDGAKAVLPPLKKVKQLPTTSSAPAHSTSTSTSHSVTTASPTVTDTSASITTPNLNTNSSSHNSTIDSNGNDSSNVDELLNIVRQRFQQSQLQPQIALSDASSAPTSSASSSTPSSTAPASTPASGSVSTVPTDSAASTFTAAASDARVDKLAILMSLFKSRGIEPPPLPLFEKLDGPTLTMDESLAGDEDSSNSQSQSSNEPITKESTNANPHQSVPSSTPSSIATATTSSSAPKPINSPPSVTSAARTVDSALSSSSSAPSSLLPSGSGSDDSAEISQLTSLFDHGRAKIFKLCRLYQSGILTGNGAAQAAEKLSRLIRTYYAFIQHARSHKHIDAMTGEIAEDIRSTSLQQLADRFYAKARE